MAATRRQHKNQKESAWVPPLQRDPGPWNRLLLNWLATLAIIMVFGLVMLYSASYTTGYLRMGDSLHYIKQQAICMAIGIGCMVVMSYVDHRFLRWASKPLYWVVLAMLAGACAGFVTAFLQTHLGVPSILAGIITNTGLYTVNLAIMGFSSNVPMLKTETVFTMARALFGEKSPYKLIVAVTVTVVACALLILFLGPRLGLSIRATGDNPDMVRASSINTAFTITVGLCVSNAMTSLSGAVLAQYQKSADINLGTGMVVIGLASLIIGETLFGRGGMWVKAAAAVAGSVIYRFIIALALRANVPSECLKLISAVIVALAIAAPALKKNLALRRRRAVSQKGGKTHA